MKTLHHTMSVLENKAMQILWKQRTCCVHMVKTELESEKKMAYTTVQTILDRLVQKELAKKHQVDKTSVYTPAVTKSAYATTLVLSLIQHLSSQYEDVLILSLAKGIAQLSEKQQKQLLQIIGK